MTLLQAKTPPAKPGVYLFKDAAGTIIYIGKAKVLRNRVRSYFRAIPAEQMKTRQLVAVISDVEYIITSSELEALVLENLLIKKHKPRYNIKLRDDKNYQFIKIDYSLPIPQIYPVRKKTETYKNRLNIPAVEEANNLKPKYSGPYTSGLTVRGTVALVKKIFPYCTAEKPGTRPCFNYQLHRCPGICIGVISREDYIKSFKQIELFLQGKTEEVKAGLEKQMVQAAKDQNFELAARLRDQLSALQGLLERQKIISSHTKNQDYISFERGANDAAFNVFLVREGKLLGRENILLENLSPEESNQAVLSAFLQRYYLDTNNVPKEVYVQTEIEDKSLIEDLLSSRFNEIFDKKSKVSISVGKSGTAKDMLALGFENARNFLEQHVEYGQREAFRAEQSMRKLKEILSLPKLPKRIECFDISNISGKYAVGSMTVFTDGKPNKSQYRKFKIRTKDTPDDFQMMSEVLGRRLNNDWPKPDLWVIDGGKGQLSMAVEILKQAGENIPVIGLGKSRSVAKEIRQEKIYKPGREDAIALPDTDPAMNLIQRIRDEAHRFAITYHRNIRSKGLIPKKKNRPAPKR